MSIDQIGDMGWTPSGKIVMIVTLRDDGKYSVGISLDDEDLGDFGKVLLVELERKQAQREYWRGGRRLPPPIDKG